MSEPKEGFIKSGSYKIHYLLWGGSGPKLVFIHSMGMDARGFDITSKSMQGDYQILALDILDHGDTESPKGPISLPEHADIMRDCYKQMGFFPTVLVGHSVGGMMGMVLAAEYPEDFKGMVLVDIAPFTMSEGRGRGPRPQPPDLFASEDEARAYFRERYNDMTEESIENRVKYSLIKDEEGNYRRKPSGEMIRGGLSADLWPFVERMSTPCMLLKGGDSTLVTDETLQRMKKTVPDLKVVEVEGVGHMVPQGKPEEFESHLRQFLKDLGL